MRIVETKLYTIEELSDEAKQNAFKNYTPITDYISSEAYETYKAFEAVFNVKERNGSIVINVRDEVQELSGVRLQTYIWNNFKDSLFKGKYYRVNANYPIKHKRVTSKTFDNGNTHNAYRSAITLESCCPLTGVCYDEAILAPIYQCLTGNFKHDYYQLISECFQSLEQYVEESIDSCYTIEYFTEEAKANEWEFDENGNKY